MNFKAVLVSLALLLAPASAYAQSAPSPEDRARSIERAAPDVRLANPFRPSGDTTVQEDEDLRTAVAAFSRRTRDDDASALEAFIVKHPLSAWTPSVAINLGDLQQTNGYFTRALASWEAGWTAGDRYQDRDTKILVDHAIGQIARMHQSFGRFDEVDKVFKRIEGRSIEGAATEKIQGARDVRRLADKDPRHLYVCGPVALRTLFIEQGGDPAGFMDLETYRATPKGTSLAELSRLATERGMRHRLVKRTAGQPIPTSALVHWKGGHFATVVGVTGNWVHIKDPAYPAGLRMALAAFEEESSGYMLVPEAAQARRAPSPWQSVDVAQVEAVMGKGPVNHEVAGGAGDTNGAPADRPDVPCADPT